MASAKNAGRLSRILDPALLVRPTMGASSTDPSLFDMRKSKFLLFRTAGVKSCIKVNNKERIINVIIAIFLCYSPGEIKLD